MAPIDHFHTVETRAKLSLAINPMKPLIHRLVVLAVDDEILSMIIILDLMVFSLQLCSDLWNCKVTFVSK